MKAILAVTMSLISLAGFAQVQDSEKTLLWKITGNGLDQPSYLFGTIHMLCKEDAALSGNLRKAIQDAEEVYFEVDLDNMMEMLSIMTKLKMNGDTTLRDLLNEADYGKVKDYFESHGSMLPFAMLETYKPILAASLLQQNSMSCEATAMMEQEIMKVAHDAGKKIKGLETMGYQASVLDNIPYKLQAEQLLRYVESSGNQEAEDEELDKMMDAYRDQDLAKLEDLISQSDPAIANYTEVLLYQRNRNWVEKMKKIMPGHTLLFAVGAGHLPGSEGVIELLRKAGFTVSPVDNKINRTI